MSYPHTPGYKDNDTSKDAAKDIELIAPTVRAKVMLSLFMCGSQTADEVADHLDLSILTVRPRFSELRLVGEIKDSGVRRSNKSGKMAKVWKLANEENENRKQPQRQGSQ